MFGPKQEAQKTTPTKEPTPPPTPLLTVVGDTAKMEGKFQIADSIQIECEVGGELKVGGTLVIGEKGIVNASVETVNAIILGHYDGSMTATGNVEVAPTGRVSGNIKTDSLVISKGASFRGNVEKINDAPARGHVEKINDAPARGHVEKINDATAAAHRQQYLIHDKVARQLGPNNSQMPEPSRPTEEVVRKL